MSVNLSSRQFAEPNLLRQIIEILVETGLDPHCLVLEITESTIMQHPESLIPLLGELKQLCIQLYVDDFGTGYSSLGYLQRFPIDKLKIDRTFIRGLGQSGDSAEIVSAIIHLAHNLGMGVIAEGVENETQLNCLASLDCEYAQGNYFQRAIEPVGASKWMESTN